MSMEQPGDAFRRADTSTSSVPNGAQASPVALSMCTSARAPSSVSPAPFQAIAVPVYNSLTRNCCRYVHTVDVSGEDPHDDYADSFTSANPIASTTWTSIRDTTERLGIVDPVDPNNGHRESEK